MWSFVPTTRAKDSIGGFRLSIRESLTTNPTPADTLDIRREKLELGEQCWRQVAPAAPLPCSLAGLLPATPVLLSSEWQLIINSTVHRINVQYQGQCDGIRAEAEICHRSQGVRGTWSHREADLKQVRDASRRESEGVQRGDAALPRVWGFPPDSTPWNPSLTKRDLGSSGPGG